MLLLELPPADLQNDLRSGLLATSRRRSAFLAPPDRRRPSLDPIAVTTASIFFHLPRLRLFGQTFGLFRRLGPYFSFIPVLGNPGISSWISTSVGSCASAPS